MYDEEIHACLIDGVRLHSGKKFSLRHNSIEDLEDKLIKCEKIKGENTSVVLIIDGVYSMYGDLTPLDQIVALKEKYDFSIIMDDSHGFGVFGQNGLGVGEHFNVLHEVDVLMSTTGKALGVIGGFVCAKKDIITYLRYNTQSQIFSRVLPLPMLMSIKKNLEIFIREPERRIQLWENINRFRKGLTDLGFDLHDSIGAVIPITFDIEEDTYLKIHDIIRISIAFLYILPYTL